jgi:hypothetical protein
MLKSGSQVSPTTCWAISNKLGLKEEQQIEKTRKIEKEVIGGRATRYARTGAI